MDPVHPSLPAPPNDTPSLPATSNDKRSSPANNEVLFALSPIDRPPLTTMQNRNLIHSGAESRDNDENEDDAHELVYPPEDGVLSRSDDVSNDKIPQHAAEHSVDIEPQ
ncbi:unnamed protein product [Rotaria socialis]|uniref:Uncharacterized protein n=2 Tax=Rotaria socialis TaxID=392032 RepID=A0A821TJQ5_9BILA|nr:unnamed protein product [Rotaria socialis]CAF3656219.1 unnamed protein product [Rotaria socialis]CAF4500033.1 unnamed protein product [Rotaria socialis]CAF4875787.1 unnamed protein product [Rotaria socialis]